MARQEPQLELAATLEEPTAPTVSAPRAHQRRGEGRRPRTDHPGEGGGYGEEQTEGRVTRGVNVAGAAMVAETNGEKAVEGAGAAGAVAEAAVAVVPGAAAADGTAAASDGGSVSPSATPLAASRLAEERVLVAEPGQQEEEGAGLAASPAPVVAAVIAAVVTAAVGTQDGGTSAEGVGAAAEFAGMPVADEGAGTQERDQAADGRQGRGKSAAAPAACGKKGKRPRAQPAARRPGAGLRPGPPGPLLGWLRQGQSPQEPGLPSSSRGAAAVQQEPQVPVATPFVMQVAPTQGPEGSSSGADGAPPATVPTAAAAGTCEAVAATTGVRRSARLGEAGEGATQHPELRSLLERALGGNVTPDLREQPQTNEEPEASDNNDADPEFMAGEDEVSEEISLDDEEAPPRRDNPAPQTREAAGGIPPASVEPAEAATGDTDVPSPADLASDDAIWHMAGGWNVDILQRSDQPFLVRRLPTQLLDRYCLCMLAALHRLDKNPSCPGGWMVLLFLPRLTLRPAPEPAVGSRWAAIEARLHKFQRGEWTDLFEEAGTIPAIGAPGPCLGQRRAATAFRQGGQSAA
ncbi:unnamed protein product [Closterium sp. Naga37s-1]|nr:unnamed protein product [Closterium sp. Naga37s-1]CAI5512277.1 unnamed protein product [Closterium sp. Naga37s-1]CAI5512281.1 unnamed protein product [Closterium sp. Naga37s-1]